MKYWGEDQEEAVVGLRARDQCRHRDFGPIRENTVLDFSNVGAVCIGVRICICICIGVGVCIGIRVRIGVSVGIRVRVGIGIGIGLTGVVRLSIGGEAAHRQAGEKGKGQGEVAHEFSWYGAIPGGCIAC